MSLKTIHMIIRIIWPIILMVVAFYAFKDVWHWIKKKMKEKEESEKVE